MERHIDMVALLFLVYGALLVVIAVVLLIVVGPGHSVAADVTAAPSSFWTTLAYRSPETALVLSLCAVPFIATAWGLRRRAALARIAALVLGGLSILSFPIGTALGAYTLWALTRPESAAAFR